MEQLQRASFARLDELIDPVSQVTGTLNGDLGVIPERDAVILETVGLPRIAGCLYPAIGERHVRNGEVTFLLGSYDSGVHYLTGQPLDGGPRHLFIIEPLTGRVAKVSNGTPDYRVPVNQSLRHFAETAWRYHHMKPILFQMQHSGEGDVPFAQPEEDQAIRKMVWDMAVRTDPSVLADGEDSFWDGATWGYL